MNVKRYEWVSCDEHAYHCDVVESAEGDMVDYEDYAALESRCAAQDEKLRMINELTGAVEQVNKHAQEATERLIQERNALAAELSAVESIHNDAVFITDEHYEQCPAEVKKIIRSLAVMQTPAYQAFLAEVRAQGVEMLNTQFKKCTGMLYADSVVSTAEHFADQLRKGVQS
ncbi:hypothetical protein [Enterobacter hormaechei]|uniref:hypothetical protein n=1 Tax=Enterobacter hormaechei TaxID=158836 RepID=UPI002FF7265E